MKPCRNKTICSLIILVLSLGFVPLPGIAGIFVDTEVVSGTITAIKDNALELDGNGVFYYPANDRIKMTLPQGQIVTLRYFLDNSEGSEPVRKYVAFSPGKNSMTKKRPPVVKKKPI